MNKIALVLFCLLLLAVVLACGTASMTDEEIMRPIQTMVAATATAMP